MAWELDGLRLKILAPTALPDDPLPDAFGWAAAVAQREPVGPPVAGSAVPTGLEVLCVWPADALRAGAWRVQVRAGATEAAARTIYDAPITIRPSLRAG